MRTLERAHKRRRICVVMMSFSFIRSGKRTNPYVFVCVRARVRSCVCIHPVEISIEKVTPLNSPRCYTLHILFMWVLVCQWDTSGTLVRRGWIGIKRGNAVWLKEEGNVWRFCQKSAFLECFTKCLLQLDAAANTVSAQRDKMRQRS